MTKSVISGYYRNVTLPYRLLHHRDITRMNSPTQAYSMDNLAASLDQYQDFQNWLRKNLDAVMEEDRDLGMKAIITTTSAQSYGAVIEKILIKEKGWSKVSASDDRGDAYDPTTGKYYEIKVTVARPSKGDKVNFVQLRPHQDIDGYYMVIINEATGAEENFYITKEQMAGEIEATGSSLAHGVRSAEKHGRDEYAIRFSTKPTDAVYLRWQQLYKADF